jgi:hypothetical protein
VNVSTCILTFTRSNTPYYLVANRAIQRLSALLVDNLILNSLPEAARRALQAMSASKYQYQSEFARRYYGQGKAEGVAEGRLEIVLKLLVARYGELSAAVVTRVRESSTTELERIAERVLTAQTPDEALSAP